jgi:hypothetical protein
MGGVEDGEQYARWVQFGAFSPILRLHSTKNQFQDRRPWGYGDDVFHAAREAMQLRHALIPYLYSMAWRFHKQAIPPILPMYYDHPEEDAAYACPNQYLYGDQLLVAPFTSPKEQQTQLTRQIVWLPKDAWYGFFDGVYYPTGWYPVYGKLDEIPVFARQGAIVPLAKKIGWGGIENPLELDVYVFPGADGKFELYEDDGDSNYYLDGKHAVTRFEQSWTGAMQTLLVLPAMGDIAQIPAGRSYDFHFRGVQAPESVEVRLNGAVIETAGRYEPDTHTYKLHTLHILPTDRLQVVISRKAGLAHTDDPRPGALRKLLRSMRMQTSTKTELWDNLEQVMHDPASLARYRVQMTDQHYRALFETILGAGMQRTKNHGGDLVVIWNNHQDARVLRTFNAYIPGSWHNWYSLFLDRETARRSEVYHPGVEFKDKPWDLRLDFVGVFTERLGEE